MRHREREALVEVEDKGKGIPPRKLKEMAAAGTPGVGMRGMQERIRQLGGTLEIRSGDEGTLVIVRLPVGDALEIAEAKTEEGSPQAAA